MDKHELAKRLMATFLEELREHVDAMNHDLLALEKNPLPEDRNEVLKVLFRSAHSLKGASRVVSADVIEHSCHMLEDILTDVREGKRSMDPPLFSLLFKVADGIQEAGMRLRDEQDLSDSPLQALIPELERAANSDVAGGKVLADEASSHPAVGEPALPPEPATPPAGEESLPDKPSSPAPATHQPASMTPAQTGGSVRVAAEKLDALLEQNGELLVARRRVEQRSLDAEELTESIAAIKAEWSRWAKPLQRFFDERGEELFREETRYQFPRGGAKLLASSGERLLQLERQSERLKANMIADSRVLQQTCDALDDEVYRVRMLPFTEACGGLERSVRDIAQTTGKRVELVIQGEDVEVDRSVLEGLKDPLLHLVRNAVDHGLEPPEERERAGKPVQGRITVSAALRAGHVEVSVADDGRGFDLQRIRERGKQRGLAVPQEEREQARMVFLPGFSTAEMVTDVSGRGVGLDVVESAVQALRGLVEIDFQPGAGSRFLITVPLTLTTVRCVLVEAGGQTYAIPTSAVQQIVRFDSDSVQTISGREMLLLGGPPTPLAGLADVLGLGKAIRRAESSKLLAIVVGSSSERVALVVDELGAEQEVLVKNLGVRIRRVRHVSGATLLPSGRVALVLNAANVLSTALTPGTKTELAIEEVVTTERRRRRLLVVDDSITTRTLMKGILEAADFDIESAADGEQAWEILSSAEFDLVVTDVDMPRMDGFELTSRIRSSSELADLPVILVTARATDEDKTRGVQVGADAYIAKSGFDQKTLLEVIEQFMQ